jgi:ATP-dependent DNA helicase PIF1
MNPDQTKAFELAAAGHNLFITGAAGTGKSFLLRNIIKRLKQIRTVAVTASTGTAAFIIQGITLHSWFSMGLAKEPVEVMIQRLKKYGTCSENIRKTQTLIIDEISQVRGDFLDKINQVAQHVRKNRLPFGGIQVIFCGDFAQLPPVMTLDIEKELENSWSPTLLNNEHPEIDYAFKSDAWKETNPKIAYLREVMRQKDDQTFINILNHIREGRVSDEDFQPLLACIGRRFAKPDGDNSDNIFPTRLVPTNADAQRINKSFYNAIDSEEHKYHSSFSIKKNRRNRADKEVQQRVVDRMIEYTKNHSTMESTLALKKGTRVILTQNVNVKLGLYNGAQGIVEEFVNLLDAGELGIPIVSNTDGKPPQLQQEGDYEVCEIKNVQPSSISVPVIRLVGSQGRYVLTPSTITVKSDFNEEPNYIVDMIQYPLKHAWALTIHKSQGMTLERAQIDAGKFIFCPGQTYTALSRVRSLEGLSLVDFDPNKVLIDPSVVSFYQSISV